MRRLILALSCISTYDALTAGESDFVAAVTATRPVAFYRLIATSGKSEAGTTAYDPNGAVGIARPGLFGDTSRSVKLNGTNAYIVTTQAGGVATAGSIMAWVNLDSLPSQDHRTFYVAGESEGSNDFDIQFEDDNALRFYTAHGGRASFAPPTDSLLHRWHMIVVTLDTASHARAIYWDGQLAASDQGGGSPNKTAVFSIGESTVFRGRYLKGQIEEVALWNRALRANEVANLYTAATSSGALTPAAPAAAPSGAGQFPSTAKVEVGDDKGPVPLKPEERIAFLFLNSIQLIESDCQNRAKHACTLDELVSGPASADGSRLAHLKFDPRTDPNYTYALGASGLAWEAHATPKKPGLIGFYIWSRQFPVASMYYNPAGAAAIIDKELGNRSVEGDGFVAR
jgi:Concanavalin A-like lectin/glucanases superfamily